jgi:flagellar basal body-associated protein FliL
MLWVLLLVVLTVAAVVGYVGMRRHGESAVAADGWGRTDEVFRDPSTGRVMRVWLDPVDGTRHYVPEPGAR